MDTEQKWYFSFGIGTEYGARSGKYVCIKGTFNSAREKMVNWYGKMWCCQYTEEEWEGIKSRFPYVSLYEEGIDFYGNP